MLALTLSALLLAQGPPAGQEKKLPVPTGAEVKEAERIVRDLFRKDYAKRDQDGRRALASKLLAKSMEMSDDPVARFVLLAEARDVASAAVDLNTAFAAIDRMAEFYEIDATAMKADALKSARKSVRTPEGLSAVAGTYLRLAETAFENDEFDAALRAAREATSLGRRARDKGIVETATELTKIIPARKREHEEVQKARLLLSVNPDDPKANLTVGRYLCLVKGEWKQGLPMLANGSDANLKAAAELELAKPEATEARVEVGDAWWALGESERDSFTKAQLLARAVHWYRTAMPDLAGLSKIKVGKRIKTYLETPSTSTRGAGIPVTFRWSMADDADVYHNGKPLREYKPNFRTRPDEAWKQFSAKAVLKRGDVITVGGRRGGSYGILLVALDESGKVVWKTDKTNWKVYFPKDTENWFLPQVALASKTIAPGVQPEPWAPQRRIKQETGTDAASIWHPEPQTRHAYLYSVVR